MSNNTISIIAVLVLLASCAASGPETKESEAIAQSNIEAALDWEKEKRKPHPGDIVCKRIRVTGSRMTERICRTHAQWQQASKEDREAIERAQRRENVASGET